MTETRICLIALVSISMLLCAAAADKPGGVGSPVAETQKAEKRVSNDYSSDCTCFPRVAACVCQPFKVSVAEGSSSIALKSRVMFLLRTVK
jgi:hypothetical protein